MWHYNYVNPDALAHAGGFKYYQKVKTANGTRYFYSPQEYRNYLGAGNKLRSNVGTLSSRVKNNGLPATTRGRLDGMMTNVKTGLPKMTYNMQSAARQRANTVQKSAPTLGKSVGNNVQNARTIRTGQAVSAQKVLRKGEQNLKTSGKDARTYRTGQAVAAQKVLRKGEQAITNKPKAKTSSARIVEGKITPNTSTRLEGKRQSDSNVKLREQAELTARNVGHKIDSVARGAQIKKNNPTFMDRALDEGKELLNKGEQAGKKVLKKGEEIYDNVRNELGKRNDAAKAVTTVGKVAGRSLAPVAGGARKEQAFKNRSISEVKNQAESRNAEANKASRDLARQTFKGARTSVKDLYEDGKYYARTGKRLAEVNLSKLSKNDLSFGRQLSLGAQQFFDDIGYNWRRLKREFRR